ncbi:MAG: DUF2695 domain-containing protein [Myxococcales bacterium]|nr:DUF2695 domain-containing protein [Myxococcales bacterium]
MLAVLARAAEASGRTEDAARLFLEAYEAGTMLGWLEEHCRLAGIEYLDPGPDIIVPWPTTAVARRWMYEAIEASLVVAARANDPTVPDERVLITGCDGTARLTSAWAQRAGVDRARLYQALASRGGYCDCEVLMNAAERDGHDGFALVAGAIDGPLDQVVAVLEPLRSDDVPPGRPRLDPDAEPSEHYLGIYLDEAHRQIPLQVTDSASLGRVLRAVADRPPTRARLRLLVGFIDEAPAMVLAGLTRRRRCGSRSSTTARCRATSPPPGLTWPRSSQRCAPGFPDRAAERGTAKASAVMAGLVASPRCTRAAQHSGLSGGQFGRRGGGRRASSMSKPQRRAWRSASWRRSASVRAARKSRWAAVSSSRKVRSALARACSAARLSASSRKSASALRSSRSASSRSARAASRSRSACCCAWVAPPRAPHPSPSATAAMSTTTATFMDPIVADPPGPVKARRRGGPTPGPAAAKMGPDEARGPDDRRRDGGRRLRPDRLRPGDRRRGGRRRAALPDRRRRRGGERDGDRPAAGGQPAGRDLHDRAGAAARGRARRRQRRDPRRADRGGRRDVHGDRARRRRRDGGVRAAADRAARLDRRRARRSA